MEMWFFILQRKQLILLPSWGSRLGALPCQGNSAFHAVVLFQASKDAAVDD